MLKDSMKAATCRLTCTLAIHTQRLQSKFLIREECEFLSGAHLACGCSKSKSIRAHVVQEENGGPTVTPCSCSQTLKGSLSVTGSILEKRWREFFHVFNIITHGILLPPCLAVETLYLDPSKDSRESGFKQWSNLVFQPRPHRVQLSFVCF